MGSKMRKNAREGRDKCPQKVQLSQHYIQLDDDASTSLQLKAEVFLSTVEKVEILNPGAVEAICGINDANLHYLEQMFGGVVFCRGNSIMLDCDSHVKRQEFRRLIHNLEGVALRGGSIQPEHIHHFLDEEVANGQYVAIPHGQRVFPRTPNQAQFVHSVRRHQLTFAIGPAGTGKTYLAVALGLAELLGKRRRKLIFTRPVVEAGESLGYLPGDLTQKINPYLRPIYDAIEELIPTELLQRLEDLRQIEVAPLAYMRGRSLKNCFVILDEAQNTTRGQMKMFLTRLGEGAKAVVTGDLTQIDLPRQTESGLLEAHRLLRRIPEIGFIDFTSEEVLRSPLVKAIIDAYESET